MTSVIVRVFVDSVGDDPATIRREPQPAMRVPDLPVQRAPVIQGLLEGEHAVHGPRVVTRRAVHANLSQRRARGDEASGGERRESRAHPQIARANRENI